MTDQPAGDTGAAPDATPSPPATGQPTSTGNNPQPNNAPAQRQDAAPVPPEPGAYNIPEAYRDKPWADKIKSEEDAWKQLENLNGLVGKKYLPPDYSKATPAEINAFKGQLRPTDKAEYSKALALDESIPEGDRTLYTELLHKAGVPVQEAQSLIKDFSGAVEAEKSKLFSDDGFKAELKQSFGDKWQETVNETSKTLRENMSPEDVKMLDEVPNKYLVMFHRLANKVNEAYGASESSIGLNMKGGVGGQDYQAQADAKYADIMALSKRPHDISEKRQLTSEYTALMEKALEQPQKGRR